MGGYWWECEKCGWAPKHCADLCGDTGVASFIRNQLIASDWKQDLLLQQGCPKCKGRSVRITYEFPRKRKEHVRLIHAVGLGGIDDHYVPMLWESLPVSEPRTRWLHFNYIVDRNPWGISRPCVLTPAGLKQILKIYKQKVGRALV